MAASSLPLPASASPSRYDDAVTGTSGERRPQRKRLGLRLALAILVSSTVALTALLIHLSWSFTARQNVSDVVTQLNRQITAAGVKPRTRHTGSSDDHIHEMVRAGLGIAISAEHQSLGADLVWRPIADAAARRRIILAAVAGRQHGPALALFLKLMRARDWTAMSGAPPGTLKS